MADGKALIAAALAKKFDSRTWKPAGKAYLCKAADSTGTLIADEANRKVWLHRNDSSAPFTAYLPPNSFINFTDGDASYETIEVRLGYPDDSIELTVRDANTTAGRAAIGSQSPAEQTIAQAYWTELQRITNLRARPTDPVSTGIAVDGPFPYINTAGNLKILTSTLTASLSATIAALAAGKHQLAITYFNRTTGALGVTTNTAVTATGSLPARDEWLYTDVEAMATAWNTSYIPIDVIYLYYGQTSVVEADFYRSWDLRPLFGGTALTLPLSMANGGTGSNLSTSDGFLRAIGGTTIPYKWKLNGTAAPAVTDDANAGYNIGSLWIDTTNDKVYGCTDNAVGAAVWKDMTAAAGTSPLTTKGDLYTYSTTNDRLPVGANGTVLTADSTASTGNKWAAPIYTIDMTGTAGEALSARDAVYLNPSDNKWYKLDIDATATVKVAKFRGMATAAISSAATGIIRLAGVLTGFTSLTAGADVYASTTAGGYTQTKPTVSAAGGQRAIVRLGFADSTTSIVIEKSPVVFAKRESLTNTSTLTLEHYADALARERKVQAYISTTTSGLLTNYASSNQDQAVPLRGGTGAGATETVTNSTLDGQPIGNSGGTTYQWAQSFQCTAGTLAQFTFALRANVGSPTGTMTWEICGDTAGAPGTVLATGTLTPTASTTNTVAVPDGLFLAASTTYWLKLYSTGAQSSNNYWSWYCSTTSLYANGTAADSTNGGSSWSNQTIDMNSTITTVATTPFDKLGQSFQVAASTCDLVKLRLRKFGSPTGTMTLRIETNSGSAPSGTLVDANATITVAESGLGTSFADVTFDFTNFSLSASTTYWLVLSTDRTASATNYVVWAVDASSPGYGSGQWATNASATWTADSTRDAIFEVDGPVTTYEAPLLVDQWGSSLAVALARYDDGAGANGDVDTTIKNATGSTIDVTCEVILP